MLYPDAASGREHGSAPVLRDAVSGCDYCNGFCALGAFGFYEQAGQIYLKHNTLVDGSLELDKIIPFVADNISVLLAAVSRFIDGLAQVAYAGMTLDAVIDQELFPKMN